MTGFLVDWRGFFGDLPPLSFALPKDNRWVRFHALPASRRYAETPNDEAIILERANTLAAEILGADVSWLVQLGSIDGGWDNAAMRWRDEYRLKSGGTVFYDEVAWPLFAGRVQFEKSKFDGLLNDIAAEKAFRTLWLSPASGRVFAPYDGGFDIFLESSDAASEMRTKHETWLSSRADGF